LKFITNLATFLPVHHLDIYGPFFWPHPSEFTTFGKARFLNSGTAEQHEIRRAGQRPARRVGGSRLTVVEQLHCLSDIPRCRQNRVFMGAEALRNRRVEEIIEPERRAFEFVSHWILHVLYSFGEKKKEGAFAPSSSVA
jgi:hypothetical protein